MFHSLQLYRIQIIVSFLKSNEILLFIRFKQPIERRIARFTRLKTRCTRASDSRIRRAVLKLEELRSFREERSREIFYLREQWRRSWRHRGTWLWSVAVVVFVDTAAVAAITSEIVRWPSRNALTYFLVIQWFNRTCVIKRVGLRRYRWRVDHWSHWIRSVSCGWRMHGTSLRFEWISIVVRWLRESNFWNTRYPCSCSTRIRCCRYQIRLRLWGTILCDLLLMRILLLLLMLLRFLRLLRVFTLYFLCDLRMWIQMNRRFLTSRIGFLSIFTLLLLLLMLLLLLYLHLPVWDITFFSVRCSSLSGSGTLLLLLMLLLLLLLLEMYLLLLRLLLSWSLWCVVVIVWLDWISTLSSSCSCRCSWLRRCHWLCFSRRSSCRPCCGCSCPCRCCRSYYSCWWIYLIIFPSYVDASLFHFIQLWLFWVQIAMICCRTVVIVTFATSIPEFSRLRLRCRRIHFARLLTRLHVSSVIRCVKVVSRRHWLLSSCSTVQRHRWFPAIQFSSNSNRLMLLLLLLYLWVRLLL